jgi:hypothetical protein
VDAAVAIARALGITADLREDLDTQIVSFGEAAIRMAPIFVLSAVFGPPSPPPPEDRFHQLDPRIPGDPALEPLPPPQPEFYQEAPALPIPQDLLGGSDMTVREPADTLQSLVTEIETSNARELASIQAARSAEIARHRTPRPSTQYELTTSSGTYHVRGSDLPDVDQAIERRQQELLAEAARALDMLLPLLREIAISGATEASYFRVALAAALARHHAPCPSTQ